MISEIELAYKETGKPFIAITGTNGKTTSCYLTYQMLNMLGLNTAYIGTIGYQAKEMKGREHSFLALNTSNYFLGKQEVRKAISYSIDKENMYL